MRKSDYSEKGEKSSCSEEIAAPKVVTLKKCEEVAFPKKKVALKKLQHMRAGKSLFEKRNQIRLVITFN